MKTRLPSWALIAIFITGFCFSSEAAKRKRPVPKLDEVFAPEKLREDFRIVREAMEKARTDQFYGTDEGSIIEHFGQAVKIVPGSERNIKITQPEDLALAELLITS
mgnify:CR=1 FL=1